MSFQVFFRNLRLDRTIEKCVQERQLFLLSAFGDYRDEVDELGVVDGAVQLTTVLYHEENFIRKIGVLYLEQFEIFEQFTLADHVVF